MSDSTTYSRPPTRNEELLGIGIVVGAILAIDAALTTGLIALVAESQISLLAVFSTLLLNVLGAPLALLSGFSFPRWVWVFIIVGWVGQPLVIWYGLEHFIDSIIGGIIASIISGIGFVSGWSVERTIDTFVAIIMPFSSGISMTGPNPFNFNSSELGVVAVGWLILFVLIIFAEE